MSKEYNEEIRLQSLKEFVDEYANEEELTSVGGVRATIDIIEEQLNNYKKLLNANPSEALECLEEISKEEVLFKSRNTIYMGGEKSETFNHKDTIGNYFKGIEDIKQALLKAQFLEEEYNNLMEDKDNLESELFKLTAPKQYLKWEDLEFKKKQQVMDVLLNGKPYILYFYKLSTQNEVNIFAIDMHIVTLNSYYPEDVQFFNDLHLERVEE